MIKVRRGSLLILGIEEANVQRLKDGDPMVVHLREVTPDASKNTPIEQIIVVHGKDWDDLVIMLKKLGVLDKDGIYERPASHTTKPLN